MKANTPETAIAGKFAVDDATGCWNWLANKAKGYGRVKVRGRLLLAHRVAYELAHGPIDAGLDLDHAVCDNPACINPAHMEPKTHKANVLRGKGACAQNARKTHCVRGHPLPAGNGARRTCMECRRPYLRDYMRAWRKGRHA